METIKNYLETMFANLPNTAEVRKAKSELLQMMEDKYSELISEGKSENEAVGTVISEFGNLEELSEELNITEAVNTVVTSEDAMNRRFVSMDEIKDYVNAQSKNSLLTGLGAFLCITSVTWPMIFETVAKTSRFGAPFMFISIFAAIALFIYSSSMMSQWKFIKNEPCQIDISTANYIDSERKKYLGTHALLKTVGVIMCAMCWFPSRFIDDIPFIKQSFGGMLMFVMLGAGVFMIIKAKNTNRTYESILSLNNSTTISGNYIKGKAPEYINPTLADVMSVYWPTVTCIYFIWSFITFDWPITWIIWPIAAVIAKIINVNLTTRD